MFLCADLNAVGLGAFLVFLSGGFVAFGQWVEWRDVRNARSFLQHEPKDAPPTETRDTAIIPSGTAVLFKRGLPSILANPMRPLREQIAHRNRYGVLGIGDFFNTIHWSSARPQKAPERRQKFLTDFNAIQQWCLKKLSRIFD